MIGSFKGHLEVVKKLIEAGADINQANKVGLTCDWIRVQIRLILMFFIHPPNMHLFPLYLSHSLLFFIFTFKFLSLLTCMCTCDAFVPSLLTQNNSSPLFMASQKGHHDVVQTLLGAGADINIARFVVSGTCTLSVVKDN